MFTERWRGQRLPWRFVQSFGVATALLLNTYSSLLEPSGTIYYHTGGPLRSVGIAPLLSMALITLIVFLCIVALQRTRLWPAAKIAITLLTVFGLSTASHLVTSSMSGTQAWLHSSNALYTAFRLFMRLLLPLLLIMALLPGRTGARIRETGQAITNVTLVAFALLGTVAIGQAVRAMCYVPPAAKASAAYVASSDGHPRVVWVVFDELSYQQAYPGRLAGLSLPNFDRLGRLSTVYSDVQPIGDQTERVLPGLLQGKVFDDLSYSPRRGVLSTLDHATGQWAPLNPAQSVFSLAQQNGWNAALAGFYNPYCRLYGAYLQSCLVASTDFTVNKMLVAASPMTDAGIELAYVFHDVPEPKQIAAHRDDANTVLARGTQLIGDPRNDFIFLHVPVPHPPAVYDRRTGQFRDDGSLSYADSLAYADIALGKLLDAVQASSRWPQTTFLLNGDHSWRVYIWKRAPGWTAEDQAMSGGNFDPRPALVVHHAGQTQGYVDSAPVSLMIAHDTVAKIIAGRSGSTPAPAVQH